MPGYLFLYHCSWYNGNNENFELSRRYEKHNDNVMSIENNPFSLKWSTKPFKSFQVFLSFISSGDLITKSYLFLQL